MPFEPPHESFRDEQLQEREEILEQRGERYAQLHPVGDGPAPKPNILRRLLSSLTGHRGSE